MVVIAGVVAFAAWEIVELPLPMALTTATLAVVAGVIYGRRSMLPSLQASARGERAPKRGSSVLEVAMVVAFFALYSLQFVPTTRPFGLIALSFFSTALAVSLAYSVVLLRPAHPRG